MKEGSEKPDGSGGADVKSNFTSAFVVGFVMHVANFTIGTFVEPVLRIMKNSRTAESKEAK